jgi:DNA-binding Xre family transcriptional regulator
MSDELPIAKRLKSARYVDFKPQPMIDRINELAAKRNASMRSIALGAGLDHQAIRRIMDGQRPFIHICILLADYLEVNPNEFLQLAGWPPLKAFDIHTASAEHLPPEAVDVAMDIAKIPEPGTRKQVAEAIRLLLKKYFE